MGRRRDALLLRAAGRSTAEISAEAPGDGTRPPHGVAPLRARRRVRRQTCLRFVGPAEAALPRRGHGLFAQHARVVRPLRGLCRCGGAAGARHALAVGSCAPRGPRDCKLGERLDLGRVPQPGLSERSSNAHKRDAVAAAGLRGHLCDSDHQPLALGLEPRTSYELVPATPRPRHRLSSVHGARRAHSKHNRAQAKRPSPRQAHPRRAVRRPPRRFGARGAADALVERRVGVPLLHSGFYPLRDKVAEEPKVWIPRVLPLFHSPRPRRLHGAGPPAHHLSAVTCRFPRLRPCATVPHPAAAPKPFPRPARFAQRRHSGEAGPGVRGHLLLGRLLSKIRCLRDESCASRRTMGRHAAAKARGRPADASGSARAGKGELVDADVFLELADSLRGAGVALGCGALEEDQRLFIVQRHAEALDGAQAQHVDRARGALGRGKAEPLDGFEVRLRHAAAVCEHPPEAVLRLGVALLGCAPVPHGGGIEVGLEAIFATLVKVTQLRLRPGVPLRGGERVKLRSPLNALLQAHLTVVVHLPEDVLRIGFARVHVLLQPAHPLGVRLGGHRPAERAALVVLPALDGADFANLLAAALVKPLHPGSVWELVEADGARAAPFRRNDVRRTGLDQSSRDSR